MRRAKHDLVHPDVFPVESLFPALAKMNLRMELAGPWPLWRCTWSGLVHREAKFALVVFGDDADSLLVVYLQQLQLLRMTQLKRKR